MDQSQLQNVANQFGVSMEAVRTLWDALVRGNGSMAQFSHHELGGSGQWMLGGMTMVGDMFNSNAKYRVDSICNALSDAARQAAQSQFNARSSQYQSSGNSTNFMSSTGANWWPHELGSPSSVGSQNESSYAYFPDSRRLVINNRGSVTVYDTLDHQIGGVSQQQGGSDSLSFTSQRGTIRVSELPIVSGANNSGGHNNPAPYDASTSNPQPTSYEHAVSGDIQSENRFPNSSDSVTSNVSQSPASPPQLRFDNQVEDPIIMIERLGKLRDAGILTEEEFASKKAELLARI